MQTIQLKVDDSSLGIVMTLLESLKKDIVKDIKIIDHKSLKLDPYFYERQKELHRLREDVKSGKIEMLSQEQYDQEIEQFFNSVKK